MCIKYAQHMAAENANWAICKLILEYIINKNPQYHEDGTTALHKFAQIGQWDICEIIIKSIRKDKHPTDNIGRTPFHLAASQGHLYICTLTRIRACTPMSNNASGRAAERAPGSAGRRASGGPSERTRMGGRAPTHGPPNTECEGAHTSGRRKSKCFPKRPRNLMHIYL